MNWNKLSENKIFIGGHHKSGTTLFLSLFDGHKDLFVYPYETRFWYSFYPEYLKELYTKKDRIERIRYLHSDLIGVLREWFDIELNETFLNILVKKYLKDDKNYKLKNYFDIMVGSAQQLLDVDKTITVSKDTHSELYANVILKTYPKSKFINIIRDPRDNCSVLLNGWDKHYKQQFSSKESLFRDIIDRGYLCTRIARENQKLYSDRYLIVKYENLINNLEETMESVSKFLNLKIQDFNLKPSFCGFLWKGNSFTDKKYKKIDSSRIGIYEKKLSKYHTNVIEYYFDEFMDYFNYKRKYSKKENISQIREHYKWLNSNGEHSGKGFRRYGS